jgi:MFS family permease
VFADPAVRRLFLIFGLAYLANQMSRPYVPVLVEGLVGIGPGLASAIALVTGTAALLGALASPFGGALGDRVGFRGVLVGALAVGGVALGLMPLAPSVPLLAGVALLFTASASTVSQMVFALLATEVAAERRSATLNLVFLPLYVSGIIGPATAAVVVGVGGIAGPFLLGAAVFIVGATAIVIVERRRAGG